MKTVLIVDDSKFMRKLLKNILSKNSFFVIAEAENGLEAIQQYKEYSPDIVLMDITMPVMNGIEALKEILMINPKSVIVICSSIGTKYHVIEALRLGAKDFVIKPNFDLIPSLLNKILDSD